jgi:hypothetical protein
MTALAAFAEMIHDKELDEIFKMDGVVTEREHNFIHKRFLPIRFLLLLSIAVISGETITEILVNLFLSISVFWFLFDLLCAKLWLKKDWDYVSPRYNPFYVKYHLFIKLALILASSITFFIIK